MKQSESRREETRIRGNEDERSDEIQDGGEIEKEEGQEQGGIGEFGNEIREARRIQTKKKELCDSFAHAALSAVK